jgi:hypothetical protein
MPNLGTGIVRKTLQLRQTKFRRVTPLRSPNSGLKSRTPTNSQVELRRSPILCYCKRRGDSLHDQ